MIGNIRQTVRKRADREHHRVVRLYNAGACESIFIQAIRTTILYFAGNRYLFTGFSLTREWFLTAGFL